MRPKRASADEAIEAFDGGAVIGLVVMVGADVSFDADLGSIGAKRRGGRGLTGLTFIAVWIWAGKRRGCRNKCSCKRRVGSGAFYVHFTNLA